MPRSCEFSMVPSIPVDTDRQALAWSADALLRAERIGDPVLLFLAADRRFGAASLAGEIDEADRCLEIMGPTAEKLSQPSLDLGLCIRARHEGADRWGPRAGRRVGHRGVSDRHRQWRARRRPDLQRTAGASPATNGAPWASWFPSSKRPLLRIPGSPAFVVALAMAYAEGDRTDDARQLLEEFAATGLRSPHGSCPGSPE